MDKESLGIYGLHLENARLLSSVDVFGAQYTGSHHKPRNLPSRTTTRQALKDQPRTTETAITTICHSKNI